MTSATISSTTIGTLSTDSTLTTRVCPVNSVETTKSVQALEAVTTSIAQSTLAESISGFYKTQPVMPQVTPTAATTYETAKTPLAAIFQQVYLFEENVAKAFGEAVFEFYNNDLSKIEDLVIERVDSIISKGIELNEKDPIEQQYLDERIKNLTAVSMSQIVMQIAYTMIQEKTKTTPQIANALKDPYQTKIDMVTKEIQAKLDTLVTKVENAGCILNKEYIALAIAFGVYVTQQFQPHLSKEALKLLGQRIFQHMSLDVQSTDETNDELLAKAYIFLESCKESLAAVLTAWKTQGQTIPVEEVLRQRRKILAQASKEGIQFIWDLKLPAPQKVVVPTPAELLFPTNIFLKNS